MVTASKTVVNMLAVMARAEAKISYALQT